jgi:hypothetical protein
VNTNIKIKLAMVENTRGDGDEYHDDPTWSDIESFLQDLNGVDRTYVCFYLHEEANTEEFLLVAGGRDALYTCTFCDGEEYILINPEAPNDMSVVMVPAGQTTGKYRKHCVSLHHLSGAVRYYFETGRRNKSVEWDIQ